MKLSGNPIPLQMRYLLVGTRPPETRPLSWHILTHKDKMSHVPVISPTPLYPLNIDSNMIIWHLQMDNSFISME